MDDLEAVRQLLARIDDPDLRARADALVIDLSRSIKSMAEDHYYELNRGTDMLECVLSLHAECGEGSFIAGLQTILLENMIFLRTTGNRRFHEVTRRAVNRGTEIRRVLLVDAGLVDARRAFADVIRNYYKPQFDAGVKITIHRFDAGVLKEHPGYDFTVFRMGPNKTFCAEGGSIHKQADEVGYCGRIWKDDAQANKLLRHHEMLRVLPEIDVPKEFLRQSPRVFIGSSSEGLRVAEHVQRALAYVAQPVVWSQGAFGLSEGTLEGLVRMSGEFDYAVLVLTPDDMRYSRGKELATARDNVLFELGLFMGSLGRRRTFIVYCSAEPPVLPSDLAGVTAATYPGNLELEVAVNIAATSIKAAIEGSSPAGGHVDV